MTFFSKPFLIAALHYGHTLAATDSLALQYTPVSRFSNNAIN